MEPRLSVGIIGAGIAGLTAAYRLRAWGADVRVFEASAEVGGAIRSRRQGGYLIEEGPNALQTGTPLLEDLIDALGLAEARVEAAPAAKRRYIVRRGKPVPLPGSPPALVRSPLFSWRAKGRLLAEPLVRAARPEAEESIADLVRRRLGQEALDYALSPFVAGIFAGDPARLSARYAFPRLYELEQAHGSLLLGSLKRARTSKASRGTSPPRRTFSFRDGLHTLPHALAEQLAGRITTEAPVIALAQEPGGWRLTALKGGTPTTHRFRHVIFAAPLHRLGGLGFETDVDLTPLAAVPYPPVTTVALGLRRDQVGHPLDGFGLLVPEVEARFQTLGTLFSSTLFPGRAPHGHVLLTSFVGGTRHPDLARAQDDVIVEAVRRDLSHLLDVRGEPAFARCARWPQAIPQYELGHGRVVATLDRLEATHAGLHFAGNYRSGIAVGDAAASGAAAAERVRDQEREKGRKGEGKRGE